MTSERLPISPARAGARAVPRTWLLVLTVSLAVLAVAAFSYEWLGANSAAPHSTPIQIGLQPRDFSPIVATGSSNGLAGCAGPGMGESEYCYSFRLAGQAGDCPPAETCSPEVPTTADNVTFQLVSPEGASTGFVNVTLLQSPAGPLLAAYTPGLGWTAATDGRLPVQFLQGDQLFVLNVGREPADGTVLTCFAWGTAGGSAPIP